MATWTITPNLTIFPGLDGERFVNFPKNESDQDIVYTLTYKDGDCEATYDVTVPACECKVWFEIGPCVKYDAASKIWYWEVTPNFTGACGNDPRNNGSYKIYIDGNLEYESNRLLLTSVQALSSWYTSAETKTVDCQITYDVNGKTGSENHRLPDCRTEKYEYLYFNYIITAENARGSRDFIQWDITLASVTGPNGGNVTSSISNYSISLGYSERDLNAGVCFHKSEIKPIGTYNSYSVSFGSDIVDGCISNMPHITDVSFTYQGKNFSSGDCYIAFPSQPTGSFPQDDQVSFSYKYYVFE